MKRLILLLFLSLFVVSCTTTKTISYFQDIPSHDTTIMMQVGDFVKVKPSDAVLIAVHTGDPELDAQFNLSVTSMAVGKSTARSSLTAQASTASERLANYTIDEFGNIRFPLLGEVKIAGLDRNGIENKIRNLLIESNLVKDPIVIVEYGNLYYSVLGSVGSPGSYAIDRDKITILEALSKAGDLKITGKRQDVLVLRTYDYKTQEMFRINLCNSSQLYASPAFYVKQNDVIYVTPNKKEVNQSSANASNFSTVSFWTSISSVLLSIVTAVVALSK